MQHEHLAPGFVIAGKYVVERTLGRGGMGAVYVVSHAHTGKRMALKCLLPEFVHNADIVGRFMREAQVMGRLQHRHVVDVFDVGRDGDVLYIVMELLEGKPLSDLLHDTALTLEEALVILLRAMEGVAAAHEHGVVHRDLKPDNIFICVGASGRLDDPRVLDFGISKLEDPAGQQLTRSGVAMGTPYYMCIEQLNGQRDLDQRVDVYAMGVILYEAIAGEPPHVADSMSALAIRVLTTEPVHLGARRPDLPPGLADVVMKAIARDRERRYRSMRQLIESLRPFVPRSAGLLVPEGRGTPLRTPRSGGSGRVASAIRPVGEPAAETSGPRRRRAPGRRAQLAWLLAILVGTGLAAFLARRELAADTSSRTDPRAAVPSATPKPSSTPASTAAPTSASAAPSAPSSSSAAPAAPSSGAAPEGSSATPPPAIRVPAAPEPSSPPASPVAEAPDSAVSPPELRARESTAAKARPRPARKARREELPANSIAAPASDAPAAPSPEPAPAARRSVQGRAGKIGSDQF